MRTLLAILTGLAAASGVFWYQNPDLELKVPESIVEQLEEQRMVLEQVPESLAAIAATATPKPVESDDEKESDDGDGSSFRVGEADTAAVLELLVHKGINASRSTHGSSPLLEWDDHLGEVARAHSEDMTRLGYFRHRNLEGLDPTERAKKAGYDFQKADCYGLAENLTIVLEHPDLDHMAAKAVLSWMGSPGHRMNLLDRDYERTGIGVSFGNWRGYKAAYLTQVFC